jgi:4-cresol dehydrogenase (hydroxylating) flavoprotein subunit
MAVETGPALPPHLSERQFAGAVGQFAAALGEEWVVTEPAALAEFYDPYNLPERTDFKPSAALFPANVEEIQAILRVANEHRIPLWTVSQGRNNAYGGAAPRLPGAVLLHLRRMDRVLEIDEECAYALVEPGVRFFDLYDAIEAGNHKLMMSVPDLGWGSVIGNTLDHGFGYTPYGDHVGAQCGMEVVLANGDIVRTGMGAMAGNRAWQTYKRGFGPSADGIFMQSNFGVVTKMGLWLLPRPECYMSCFLSCPKESDLAPLVETIRPLVLDRTIPNYPIIGNILGAAQQMSRRKDWYRGTGALPGDVLDAMTRRLGLGRWNMRFALYGHEAVVDSQYKLVERAVAKLPGATLGGRKYQGAAMAKTVPSQDRIQAGIPGLDILEMVKWYGADEGGHLDFSPVAKLTGPDLEAQTGLVRGVAERFGFDYAAGIIVMPRSAVQICLLCFDKKNPAQVENAFACCKALVVEAGKAGYGEYRAHLEVMDLVAAQYGFNDRALQRLNQRLKDAFDPNGILSPGKQGIWPKSMREGR